jgi:hypothetical protein
MAQRIDTIRWMQPWRAIIDEVRRESLERQLRREVSPGHPLHGIDVRAVARRMDRDVVCYELLQTGQFAVVQLTFKLSQRPPAPESRIHDDVGAFVEECMNPDHLHWRAAAPSH